AKAQAALNVFLKVTFAEGGGETNEFRFIGDEGVMTVGSTVTVARKPRPKEPGYTIETFPKAVQEQFLKAYRAQYPQRKSELRENSVETYSAPSGYSDTLDHFTNCSRALRSRPRG